jgi:hypothetical protein
LVRGKPFSLELYHLYWTMHKRMHYERRIGREQTPSQHNAGKASSR